MDGGGIVRDGAKTVTAWRREEDIYVDEPGKAEQKVGTGKDVAIAARGDRVYALWVSGADGFEAWNESGMPETIAKAAAFPSVVALPGGGFLAAWEAGGTVRVEALAVTQSVVFRRSARVTPLRAMPLRARVR